MNKTLDDLRMKLSALLLVLQFRVSPQFLGGNMGSCLIKGLAGAFGGELLTRALPPVDLQAVSYEP
jgi:hypothetical protein